jgi:hypothetical protein
MQTDTWLGQPVLGKKETGPTCLPCPALIVSTAERLLCAHAYKGVRNMHIL